MVLMLFLLFFSFINAGEYNAVLHEDIEEQLVFIQNNLKTINIIEKDLDTATKRGIQTREACIRSKITAIRVLELVMKSELSNDKINIDRVLKLRQINNNFSKLYSEIESCKKENKK